MKIILFGTPDYVVPIFEKLARNYEIVGVVTAQPAPVGREKKMEFSEVDYWAYKKFKKKVPILHDPEKVLLIPASLGVVASYGQIISQKVIDHFPQGILNVHPSLLPLHRGAAPVPASMISNSGIGLTIIKMDYKMDHGPIVSFFKEEIGEKEMAGSLRKRLFERAAEFLVNLIPSYLDNKINLKTQNEKEATFTRQMSKEDGFINPHILESIITGKKSTKKTMEIEFMKGYETESNAVNLERFIRAMDPWPKAWTNVYLSKDAKEPKRLKILKAHLEEEKLILDEVQLEGKTAVTWEQFKDGYPKFDFKRK